MQSRPPRRPAGPSTRCLPAACLLPALCTLALAACQSGPSGLSPGLSGMRTDMQVQSVRTLGPYLAAELRMGDEDLDAYALPTPSCRAVFEAGAEVVYVDDGPVGTWHRGEQACQGMGVGHLLVWRNRNRHSVGEIAPRGQANYHVVHEGDDYALLRGLFPGAQWIGFTGAYDLIAIVPTGGECARVIEERTASIEYRDKGSRVLSLVGPDGLCEIHGLAQPPPQVPPSRAGAH